MNQNETCDQYSTSLRVEEPDSDQEEQGFQNELCECTGQALPPGADPSLAPCELHIIAQDFGQGTPGRYSFDPANNPRHICYDISNQQTPNWGVSGVYCNDESAPTGNNSAVYVRAMWADTSAWPPTAVFDPNPAVEDWITREYRAKTVPFCGEAAPTVAAYSSSPSRSRLMRAQDVEATGHIGDWLSFNFLQAATAVHHPFGYRLMVNGSPLRTSALRVTTPHVNIGYAYGSNFFSSRRPSGPTLTASDEVILGNYRAFAFHRLPTWALFIWQGDRHSGHVLSSQSINSPDILGLDPNRDVFVQLNFHRLFATSGTFDLHIGPAC